MTIDEAKALLATCKREELCDHTFGDREIYWMRGDDEIASGYLGSDTAEVSIGPITFKGPDAALLANVGTSTSIERNDSTGPTVYRGA